MKTVVKILSKWWPIPVLFVLAPLGVHSLSGYVGLHVDEPRPGSAADATAFTLPPPPTQATRMWVASYERNGGWGFAHYLRFEAPPAICRQYAAAVVPGVALSGPANFKTPLDPGIFKDMSWFDLDKAETLIDASGCDPRPTIHVWVDTVRGVFYFMETD